MTPELAAEKAREAFQLEIKLQRVRLDMSQRELAQTLNISAPLMSELLADPDKLSVNRLRCIIGALDMDPVTILRFLGFSDKAIKALQAPHEPPMASGSTLTLTRYR
jgi:transcriptional regulator with XRE-family HTH domain